MSTCYKCKSNRTVGQVHLANGAVEEACKNCRDSFHDGMNRGSLGGVPPREGPAGSGGNVGDQGPGDHGKTVSPTSPRCDRCSRVTLEELKPRKFDGFLRRICPTCTGVYDGAVRECLGEAEALRELLRKIKPAIMELSEPNDQDCEVQGRLDEASELLKDFE